MSTPRRPRPPEQVGDIGSAADPSRGDRRGPAPRAGDAEGTLTGSAAMSLVDLRRHLLRRAGELGAQARLARTRGDAATAQRLTERAAAVRRSANQMNRAPRS